MKHLFYKIAASSTLSLCIVAAQFAPTTASAGASMSQTLTCASTQNITLSGFGSRAETLTINVGKGDSVTATYGTGNIRPVSNTVVTGAARVPVTGAARIPIRGGARVPVNSSSAIDTRTVGGLISQPGGTRQSINAQDPTTYTVPAGVKSVSVDYTGSRRGRLTVSCTVAPPVVNTPDITVNTVSAISANSQTTAISTGISTNTRLRLGGNAAASRTQVTRSMAFLSTQSLPGTAREFGQPDWNAWVSTEGRQYSGTLDGWSADVSLGVDRLLRDDVLLGGLLGVGRMDVDSSAQNVAVTTVSLGAYFAKRFQDDLYLDGFISAGRPDYQAGNAKFTAQRTAASLALTGSVTEGYLKITPTGKVSAYRENQPAYTSDTGNVAANAIDNVNVNIGAKLEPLTRMANGLLPYVSFGADYATNTSTVSGTHTFFTSRIGAGFGVEMGAGYLNFDLDSGNVQKDVRDIGVQATYQFSF